MTEEELDQLVARANETIGSHESATMARLVHSLADAITALRERVAELETRIPTAAVAAMQDGFKVAIDKRDSRIAELEADAERYTFIKAECLEQAAKVCEKIDHEWAGEPAATECAECIRALKDKHG